MKSKGKWDKHKILSIHYEFFEGSVTNVLIPIFADGGVGNSYFVLSTKEQRNKSKRRYYKNHKVEFRKSLEKYHKTEKGKKVRSETVKKANAKHRELGFHQISLLLNCEFDWHHVNENDVVAIPRWIHEKNPHKLGDGNKLEGILG